MADERFDDDVIKGQPWNWCEHCDQQVDADDIHDGSEVRCLGCSRVYVCTFFAPRDGADDGSWVLIEAE